VNDINKERRVIPSKVVPSTPPSSEAQRHYDSLPKSQAIRQPAGVPGGTFGGSKDPRRND
jgi:hypothetical protein